MIEGGFTDARKVAFPMKDWYQSTPIFLTDDEDLTEQLSIVRQVRSSMVITCGGFLV